MTITLPQYALLAANVYGNSTTVRTEDNTLPTPEGWISLRKSNDAVTGFMASSFVKENQVVISYAGTTPGAPDWFTGNIPAATGVVLAPQILQAACFYIDTLESLKVNGELPSNLTVSFTGHSLGGGLASLMSVYFDLPATVFDEAPFKKSADSLSVVTQLKAALLASQRSIPNSLAAYVAVDPTGALVASPSRLERQSAVSAVAVKGEVLSLMDPLSAYLMAALLASLGQLEAAALVAGIDKIVGGQEQVIDTQTKAMLGWMPGLVESYGTGPVSLHSMTLLSGLLQSNAFKKVVVDNPEVLARLLGGNYENDPTAAVSMLDFLVKGEVLGAGSLSVFAEQLQRLNPGGLSAIRNLDGARPLYATYVDFATSSTLAQLTGTSGLSQPISRVSPSIAIQPGFVTLSISMLGGEAVVVRPELANIAQHAINHDLGRLTLLTDPVLQSPVSGVEWANYSRYTFQNGSGSMTARLDGTFVQDVVIGWDYGDLLDGGAGDDLMAGGKGSDTYVVESASDLVIELAGEGVDTVDFRGSVKDYTLTSNVENLNIHETGHAELLRGNSLDNRIEGGVSTTAIYGEAGEDTLVSYGGTNCYLEGGTGENTYYVTFGDKVSDKEGCETIVLDTRNSPDLSSVVVRVLGSEIRLTAKMDEPVPQSLIVQNWNRAFEAERLGTSTQRIVNTEDKELAVATTVVTETSSLTTTKFLGGNSRFSQKADGSTTFESSLEGGSFQVEAHDVPTGDTVKKYLWQGVGQGDFELIGRSSHQFDAWANGKSSESVHARTAAGELLSYSRNADATGTSASWHVSGASGAVCGSGTQAVDGSAEGYRQFTDGSTWVESSSRVDGYRFVDVYYANGDSQSACLDAYAGVTSLYRYASGTSVTIQRDRQGAGSITVLPAGTSYASQRSRSASEQTSSQKSWDANGASTGWASTEAATAGEAALAALEHVAQHSIVDEVRDTAQSLFLTEFRQAATDLPSTWEQFESGAFVWAKPQVFNLGGGYQVVQPHRSSAPAEFAPGFVFGAGIVEADVRVSRDGSSLLLRYSSTDCLEIKDWYQGDFVAPCLDFVQFSDGVMWSPEQLSYKGLEVNGSSDADRLQGLRDYRNLLSGGAGADTLIAGARGDSLFGGQDDDLLQGGAGADILDGGAGNDTLGGTDPDKGYLYGGQVYRPSAGNRYAGGAGNDLLYGTTCADTYTFNLGDGADTVVEIDILEPLLKQTDVIAFGGGILAANVRVTRLGHDLNLAISGTSDAILVKGWFSSTSSNQVEQVTFENGTSWSAAYLTQQALTVTGTAGDDTLQGLDGFDNALYGGSGNDVLQGSSGNDLLDGGSGSDALQGNGGEDQVWGGTGDFDDILFGNEGADRLYGGGGNDFLEGGNGTDFLDGGPGDDVLRGSEMDDELWGQGGADYLQGQQGFDRLYGGSGADALEGGDGNDLLAGGDGNDRLLGEIGADALWGGSGDDVLEGGEGDDKLYGESGADTLFGGAGHNVLSGGVGADIFSAAGTRDELWGGGDWDRYELTPTSSGTQKVIFEDAQGGEIDLSAYAEAAIGISLTKTAADQVILSTTEGEQIVVNGWSYGTTILKSGASSWSHADITNLTSNPAQSSFTLFSGH